MRSLRRRRVCGFERKIKNIYGIYELLHIFVPKLSEHSRRKGKSKNKTAATKQIELQKKNNN